METTGKSRLEAAKAVGIKFEITLSLPIDDGINAGRMFFQHLWIDEAACHYFLDAIAQYRREWDDAKGMFKENPRHNWTSHAADVHKYAAIDEKRRANQVFTTPPVRMVKPYYPELGV